MWWDVEEAASCPVHWRVCVCVCVCVCVTTGSPCDRERPGGGRRGTSRHLGESVQSVRSELSVPQTNTRVQRRTQRTCGETTRRETIRYHSQQLMLSVHAPCCFSNVPKCPKYKFRSNWHHQHCVWLTHDFLFTSCVALKTQSISRHSHTESCVTDQKLQHVCVWALNFLLSQPPLSHNRAPCTRRSTLWRKFNKPTRTTSGAKLRFLFTSILRIYNFRVQSFTWHNKTICSSERRGGASTGGEQTSRGGETSGGEGEEGDGREAGQGEGEESEGESSADRRGEVSPTHSSSNTPRHLQESQPISSLSVCLRIRQRQRDEEEREREQQRQVRTPHTETPAANTSQVSEYRESTALLLEDGGGTLQTNVTMKLRFTHQTFIHRLTLQLQHLVSCVANSHLVLPAPCKSN